MSVLRDGPHFFMKTHLAISLSNKLPNLATWERYKSASDYRYERRSIPGLSAAFYRKRSGRFVLSAGKFWYKGKLAFIAWGLKSSPVCGYYVIALPNGRFTKPISGCPDFHIDDADKSRRGFMIKHSGRIFRWPGASRSKVAPH